MSGQPDFSKQAAVSGSLTGNILTSFYQAVGGYLITTPVPAAADYLVLLNLAQTLVNKTLTNPVIAGAGITFPDATLKATAGINSKLITASRAAAAASGDVSYTGVGFKPSVVICLAETPDPATPEYSIGFADGELAEMCMYQPGTVGAIKGSLTQFIRIEDDGGLDIQSAVLKTLDTNGFTLTWTKDGTPGYSSYLIFLCMR